MALRIENLARGEVDSVQNPTQEEIAERKLWHILGHGQDSKYSGHISQIKATLGKNKVFYICSEWIDIQKSIRRRNCVGECLDRLKYVLEEPSTPPSIISRLAEWLKNLFSGRN